MGRAHRNRPERLGEKLRLIRKHLNFTQEQLIKQLAAGDESLYPASISQYEQGKREPPLLVLLRYARLVDISMETLVDDELDLPKKFYR